MTVADPTIAVLIDTPSAAGALGYLVLDDATHGKLDTAKLAPASIYVDQGAFARSFNIKRGGSVDGPIAHSDAGTLGVLLDNRTRAFDPSVSSDIRPGRPIKIDVTYNGTTYEMFTGVTHNWQMAYPSRSSLGDATTAVSANDGIAQLTSLNLNLSRPEELSGARLQAIANYVGWPSGLQNFGPGQTLMPASNPTAAAWTEMLTTVDSEMGDLYVETDGTLVFRDRDQLVTDARSTTSQGTFGDAPGELKFGDVTLSYSDDQIRNVVTITYNDGGDTVTASDGDSVVSYGEWSYALTTKMSDSNVAAAYAAFLCSQYAQPLVRVTQLTVTPYRDPANLWPQVLGRKLGDRITVNWQPPGGGARISHDCFIRGIAHDVTPGRNWTTTFTTQDASLWPSVFRLGTSVLDGPDILWF